MSASGFTPISLYYSSTGAAVPSAGNLVAGELALNTNDGKLYYKNSSGVVTLLAGATSGPAGGSTTQVQYNNAGVLAGITGATTNGTAMTLVAPVLGTPASGTVTNLTGTASININGTVGATTPAAGAFTSLTASTTLGVTGVSTLTAGAVIQGLTVGRGAGAVSTNTAVGASALAANTSGGNNTAAGYLALSTNSTGANNSAFGLYALRLNTGSSNSAFGVQALEVNTGSYNSAFGQSALQANTTASNNTAVGYQAGYSNTTGTGNVVVGQGAGYTSSGGSYNTYIGTVAGNSSTGNNNQFIGNGAGRNITGSGNSVLGNFSGNQGNLDIRTASNYIVLSDGDGNPRGYFDNSGVFYVGTTTANSGVTILPSFSSANSSGVDIKHTSTSTNGEYYVTFQYNGGVIGYIGQSGTTAVSYNTSSDYRLKNTIAPITGALAKVVLLKPCTYKWNADGSDGEGFIAHELAEVCPHAVTGEKDAVNEDGSIKSQGIDTSFLVATLTAAIQELKAIVDAQATRIAALEAR